MKSCVILTAMVFLVLQPLLASSDAAKKQDALKKVEQAVARTNIFELPSFQMKATVQIENQGKLVDGSYQLLWNGPEQWREEIQLPGYSEIQVGGKETVWIQRSTDFLPLRIHDLHTALGFGSGGEGSGAAFGSLVQSGLTPTDTVKKMRQRKEHGEAETCVEYENEVKRSLEICVNETTNTLARGSSAFADKDFQPVGGNKVYPRSLSFVEEGKTVAKADITEFTTPGQFSPNSFTPPAGVSPRVGCMNPAPARLIKRRMPEYPDSARRGHVEGTVALDAWIGIDGIPRIGEVVRHSTPDLEHSSISALKEWRYQPTTCNGKPVEVETILTVNYSLR
ncbi:MAG: energy transducer TonB [Acidobacteriia bacterium]|nr:energy transducer TonB [Terriglobia bacterium]